MNTPMIDAVRDYSERARAQGLARRMTLGSTAMRALEREVAATGMRMAPVERPTSRVESTAPSLLGIEIVEAKEEPAEKPRRSLGIPTFEEILEILR